MRRSLTLIALLLAGWCVMTVTHECGHIVGGWLGGGTLIHAELRPWHLPHSLLEPDPHPLLTVWSGPLLGVIVPVLMALIIRRRWMWFFADFCLLANGAYLATGWIAGDRYLDTQRLFDAGAWRVSVVVYCAITIGIGYVRFRRDCMDVLKT
ncbi:MAG: hypothetical protein Q8K78_19345 [Planctomycetaceae bacterium]|nr:hypothetical protein [Planctomycetaceae bacterium]